MTEAEKTVHFEIEDDVPLTGGAKGRGRAGQSKYPFEQMQTGQSFNAGDVKAGTIRSAIGAFMKAHKGEGFKFSVRETDAGVRVWRTE